MAFKLEFYKSCDNCDRCTTQPTNLHMELTTRYAAERNRLSFCWPCWRFIRHKADRAMVDKQGIPITQGDQQ